MTETSKAQEGPAADAATPCGVTVMRHKSFMMAKSITADGQVLGYPENAATFDMVEVPLKDLDALYALMDLLQDPAGLTCCFIRAGLIGGPKLIQVRRRLHYRGDGVTPTIREVARWWLALDFDSIPAPDGISLRDLFACGTAATALLPQEFHGRRAIVQATASHMLKPGIRIRLWYWLSRATSGPELKKWLGKTVVDKSVFSCAEPIYVAPPYFADPRMNPLQNRLAILEGDAEPVKVPPPSKLAPKPREDSGPLSVPGVTTLEQVKELVYVAAGAKEGHRNEVLFRCSCRMGEAVAGKLIGLQQAFDLLVQAGSYTGLDQASVEATVSSGLRLGQAEADPYERAQRQFSTEVPPEEASS